MNNLCYFIRFANAKLFLDLLLCFPSIWNSLSAKIRKIMTDFFWQHLNLNFDLNLDFNPHDHLIQLKQWKKSDLVRFVSTRFWFEFEFQLSWPSLSNWNKEEKSNLIRLVSTKFGQTHCNITPVLAKFILFCMRRIFAMDLVLMKNIDDEVFWLIKKGGPAPQDYGWVQSGHYIARTIHGDGSVYKRWGWSLLILTSGWSLWIDHYGLCYWHS